jgi:putative endonuclease
MDSVLGMNESSAAGSVARPREGDGMTKTHSRAEIGALGEQLAVDHLRGLGWHIVERNWRCRYGELDVVAVDGQVLVFVEVKTRTGDQFGGAVAAVTPAKVRRLRRLAGLWLGGHRDAWAAVRIDVVAITFGRSRTPEIVHLQGVG